MSEINTSELNVDQLAPITCNPNQMAEVEFAELVNGVKHLGRLPKPVVVRQKEDLYETVDGEHSLRAAMEVGLDEAAVEAVERYGHGTYRRRSKICRHRQRNPRRGRDSEPRACVLLRVMEKEEASPEQESQSKKATPRRVAQCPDDGQRRVTNNDFSFSQGPTDEKQQTNRPPAQ